jgi:hypothetical protein
MGQRRRRRIIWIPYGYHLKNICLKNIRLKNSNRVKYHSKSSQIEAVDGTDEPAQPSSESETATPQQADPACPDQADGYVAQFHQDLNPYHAFLQDLPSYLSSMPEGTFTRMSARMSSPHSNSTQQDRNPAAIESNSQPSPEGCESSDHHKSEQEDEQADDDDSEGNTASRQPLYIRPQDYPSRPKAMPQLSPPNVASRPAELHKPQSTPAQSRPTQSPPTAVKKIPAGPNLRLLTGIRSCLRAPNHQ